MKQFIYKIQRQQLQVDEPLASLVLLDSGMALLGHFPLLVKRLGAVKAFKLGLKVLSGRGAYYAVIEDKQLLSDGHVTFGYCNHYQIASSDAVVGPVETLEAARGRGLATKALAACVRTLFERHGVTAVYIDTAETNLAMQKVIEKVGFGPACDAYDRPQTLV